MDVHTAAGEIQGMRQLHQIPEIIRTDVPETPVGDLHLAVCPAALVFADKILQIAFFIPSNDVFVFNPPDHRDALIRPGTAQAVVSGKNVLRGPLLFRVCKHCGYYDGKMVIDVSAKEAKEKKNA